jgi:2-polyprenyl-3-methyl-5-hydroxy-6-metoxy-1,4-benzoquinol methylase
MTKLYDVDRVPRGDAGNSHSLIVELVGPDRRVLDVGCATGYVARTLVENGCTVIGVDNDREAVAKASDVLARGIVADLDTVDLVESLGEKSVDVIVFGDVLEHLRSPAGLVRQARRLLTDGGHLVCSIPNVAHGDVRLALLAGHWDYNPLGLLDDTHIRFFTEETFRSLLRDAGFAVVETRRIRVPLFASEIGVAEADFSPQVVNEVRAHPDHDVYQLVLRAVPDDAAGAVAVLSAREHDLEARVGELESRLAHLGDQLAVSEQTAEQVPALTAALRAAQDQELSRRRELAALRATRTFRWTAPLRVLRAATRGVS